MLAVTRMPGQGIKIGDAVVWINGVRGNKVRLVIDAPREIRIIPIKGGEAEVDVYSKEAEPKQQ